MILGLYPSIFQVYNFNAALLTIIDNWFEIYTYV